MSRELPYKWGKAFCGRRRDLRVAMFTVALAHDMADYLVGMAVGGLGFGVYLAVDLALVTDVLRDNQDAGKNLGVFNIVNAVPYSIAPALARDPGRRAP